MKVFPHSFTTLQVKLGTTQTTYVPINTVPVISVRYISLFLIKILIKKLKTLV